MHIILAGELVELLDRFADQMAKENPWHAKPSRTDAIKTLVVDGLKKQGLLK
jgi:hypothetical protein